MIHRAAQHVLSALRNSLLASAALPNLVRTVLYRLTGLRVALGSRSAAGCIFRTGKFELGGGSTLNYRCVVDNFELVRIGRDCGIGIGVQFITSTHDYSNPKVRAGVGSHLPITVGDGVWVGSGAMILAGVNIGSGAVVAAGAIVNSDVPAHTLVGGIPARHLKDLNAEPDAGAAPGTT